MCIQHLIFHYFVGICSIAISQIRLHDINSLCDKFPSCNQSNHVSSCASSYNKLIGEEDYILNDIVRKHTGDGSTDAFIRAGPRSTTHFVPNEVRAAIVTCGGLCPGLNSVIRELTHALVFLYNADLVLGIR
jgi:6-phosphofructokinase 1